MVFCNSNVIVMILSTIVMCQSLLSSLSRKHLNIGKLQCARNVDDILKTPVSMMAMMVEISEAAIAARSSGVGVGFVDFPVPVTGGTELDEWPGDAPKSSTAIASLTISRLAGGIKQKYSVLRPILIELMKLLNFTSVEYSARNYLGGENGEGVYLRSTDERTDRFR